MPEPAAPPPEHEEQLRKRRKKYAETRDVTAEASQGDKGDTGTQGDTGAQGNAGTRGKTGKTGQGWGDRRILFLLLFVTIVFLLLSFRSELNARNIRYQQHRQDAVTAYLQTRLHARTQLDYQACLVRVKQLDAQAAFAREFYAEELAGPTPAGKGGAQLKAARLASSRKLLAASQHADCVRP